MAKRNVVGKQNVKQADEALEQLNVSIEKEEQQAEIISAGNKVRKSTSFGSILKGINEVRKMRLKKFKDE